MKKSRKNYYDDLLKELEEETFNATKESSKRMKESWLRKNVKVIKGDKNEK